MNSNIFDKNGIEVKEGDILQFPYITPYGEVTEEIGFYKEVVFKFGCFGYFTKTHFEPLFKWQKTYKGDYISNAGNETIYTEEYLFTIKQ